jgi:putative spermidine/putrescine transport system substrate-binding protein
VGFIPDPLADVKPLAGHGVIRCIKERRGMFKHCTVTVFIWSLLTATPSLADGPELVIVSFGGANRAAQGKAFYEPWEKSGNGRVIAGEYNGELASVRSMVQGRDVTWDLVEVESPELARGCDEGLFEPIDSTLFGNTAEYVKGTVDNCGVGFFVWSTVLAFNADKFEKAPGGWADFWNTGAFPGKRALRTGAKYNLEIALMADGVAPRDVYKVLASPAGQDRAFAKLTQLKPDIRWWTTGAQPAQYLASGEVVMSSAYNGRITPMPNLRTVWSGGLYDFDAWAIPKGAKNIEAAQRFMAYSVMPEPQSRYSRAINYGPVNLKAIALLERPLSRDLPTSQANLEAQMQIDATFWAEHGEQLERRFESWVGH